MWPLVEILDQRFGKERPFVGAEIGVNRAKTSARLLRAFPNLFLWMVDHWDSSVKPLNRYSRLANQRYKISVDRTSKYAHRRQVIRQWSVDAAPMFDDDSLDFVFIDADHWYENVKCDIALWWTKVKVGGLLMGHDYRKDKLREGVAKAVDEFVAAGQYQLETFPWDIWCVPKSK